MLQRKAERAYGHLSEKQRRHAPLSKGPSAHGCESSQTAATYTHRAGSGNGGEIYRPSAETPPCNAATGWPSASNSPWALRQ
eukprot:992195-Pleurochrysis_carterae.AAC.2